MEKDGSKNSRDRRAEKFHYPRIESGSSGRSGRVPEKSVVTRRFSPVACWSGAADAR